MLKIRLRDWLYIFLLALLLGSSISGFVASLYGEKIQTFVVLGILTSTYIFLLSFLTTEVNNRWIVKRLPDYIKTPFSLMLAFLSGFLGAIAGYCSNELLNITHIHLPINKVLSLSFFLGVMTASLGYLLYKLVSLQRKEEESRRLLLEEHIRNLESQISPHFMFNTLNALAELVWQDQSRAERAILSLARLLRKSLHLEPYITLEEEVELLKDYWDLMSLRFTGRIELDIQLDERLLSLKVPKFSLQILVENALRHGLKLKHGYVKIRAYQEGSKKVVEVEDNGIGFEKLTEGVGLRNLRKRLDLCGGRLFHKSENGTTVFRMVFNG